MSRLRSELSTKKREPMLITLPTEKTVSEAAAALQAAVEAMASLHIQTASVARVLIGGALFGSGMAVFGLCPGTSVAACGEGRRDAMTGVLGMLFGAGTYVALFPKLQPVFKSMSDWGKVTLPQITGTSPWIWVAALAVVIGFALAWLERRHPQPQTNP